MRTLSTLACLLAAPAAAQHDEFEAALARFEARLAQDVAKDGVGAIAAAVVVGKEIRWERAFGWADTKTRTPATPATSFRTGSISKSITAAALARLLDQKKLRLDDKVVTHLPAFAKLADDDARAATVSLRQLASHSGGLIREPRLRGAATGPIADWEAKVLASIPKTKFLAGPGGRYSYSNIGYGILGLTIARAANKPFMQLVKDEVFTPLGMKQSTFVVSAAQREQLAAGYVNRRAGIDAATPAREHAGRGYKVPNGGVYSTAADLCRFAAGVYGADYLQPKTRAQVLRVQTPGSTEQGYGLGFAIRRREDGGWSCGHGGSVAGYTAHLVFDPGAKIGVAILRNYNSGRTSLGRETSALLAELVAVTRNR